MSEGSVLVVEDDPAIRRGLRTTLTAMAFDMSEAVNGEDALMRLRTDAFDAVLLDLNMPGMGGAAACRRIRRLFPQIAILVVTVRDSEEDKINLLDAGADDYITKPFKIGELAARIRSAIRRGRTPSDPAEASITVGTFELDPARRRLRKAGKTIRLTPTEFDLLHYLMARAGRPVRHEQLLSSVWGPEYGNEREYLRTYIMQLRRKIEDDPSQPAYLLTDNYIGYRFNEAA